MRQNILNLNKIIRYYRAKSEITPSFALIIPIRGYDPTKMGQVPERVFMPEGVFMPERVQAAKTGRMGVKR